MSLPIKPSTALAAPFMRTDGLDAKSIRFSLSLGAFDVRKPLGAGEQPIANAVEFAVVSG